MYRYNSTHFETATLNGGESPGLRLSSFAPGKAPVRNGADTVGPQGPARSFAEEKNFTHLQGFGLHVFH